MSSPDYQEVYKALGLHQMTLCGRKCILLGTGYPNISIDPYPGKHLSPSGVDRGKHKYETGGNHSLASLLWLDLLPAKNGEEQTVQFLLEVVDILLNYVRKTFDRSTKVLDFHHPHQLLEGMEGFNLELSDHPESLEQILVDCRDTLKYGVRTGKREDRVTIHLS